MTKKYDIDPCALLTAEDVGDALSQPVGAGKRNEVTCTWTSSDGDVSMTVVALGEGRKPRNFCSDAARGGEPVEGLAISAAYSKADGLSVFTGKKLPAHSCLIFASSPRKKLGLDALKKLAEIALANHPFKEDD